MQSKYINLGSCAIITTKKIDTKKRIMDRIRKRVLQVFDTISVEMENSGETARIEKIRKQFSPGKMLRSRLGLALFDEQIIPEDHFVLACAATEMIHTATLFHDDVIDGATLRRQCPSLWQEVGTTGAILMGDFFFSSALQFILETGKMDLVSRFVHRVNEVCSAEILHELVYCSKEMDVALCAKVARGKTGPLFAYIAEVCGGEDQQKITTFRDIGYTAGTAYQITDDLLDICGDENVIGKTLGTDRKRNKYTLAQRQSQEAIQEYIFSLCSSVLHSLKPWSTLQTNMQKYFLEDMFPFWNTSFKFSSEAICS